ncbi:hypothetical protein EON64_11745, partial [archaeon]
MATLIRRSVVLGGRKLGQASVYRMPCRTLILESGGLIGLVQGALVAAHDFTGLPWWSTIALSTVTLRIGLLPLVHQQSLVSRKLAKAMPELSLLVQLYRQKVGEARSMKKAHLSPGPDNIQSLFQLTSSLRKGIKATLALHDIRMLELLGYPLIHLYLFCLFVFSVRDLVLHGPLDLGLEQGGLGWFRDLSERDGSLLLPLTALSLSYANIDTALNYNSSNKSGALQLLRDGAQSLLLLSLPMVSTLPCGVFCYWIPNGIMTTLIAMRR